MTKASVIVFPGSNCDRDVKIALEQAGATVTMVWHGETSLPKSDLVVLPGGFSYGDYLRSGAIAAHSPILREVVKFAKKDGYILGICNGFQVLAECKLVPGVLMQNAGLKFICKDVFVKPENHSSIFTKHFKGIEAARIPIAHHEGNYYIEKDGLIALKDNGQIAFRYADGAGKAAANSNPNGSIDNIAGVFSANKRILGLMPHPERLCEPAHGGEDGKLMFTSMMEACS